MIAKIERNLLLMITRILLALTIVGTVMIGVVACSSATNSNALVPTATVSPTLSPSQAPHVGTSAPDFALDTLDGSRKVHLSDFHGKAILLIFWTSTCSTCVKELPAVQKFSEQQKAGGKQIVVLAIDMDRVGDFANVAALQERFGLTYPILVDDHFQARSSYKITNVPVAYFMDSQRVIRVIISGSLDNTESSREAERVEGK
jgi:peroxiredoxin